MAARRRSHAPARKGIPLAVTVIVPAAAIALALAVAVGLVVNGAGERDASKERAARVASVKHAWQAAGRPTRASQLARLGQRLGAELRVVRANNPQRAALRVSLAASGSRRALSDGLVDALIVSALGLVLLCVALAAIIRTRVTRPLGALAQARRPAGGVCEVRAVNAAFGRLTQRAHELERLAGTDALTGLITGPRVYQTLEVELKRADRELAPMALVLLDIDGLKRLNDARGKQAGDTAIRTMAARLGPTLRATDVFCRLVGDEFALLLPKATPDHVEQVIDRAREELHDLSSDEFEFAFSAGYALYPSDARDGEAMMQAAEGALRLAQRQGGCTRRFDPAEVTVEHNEGDRHEVLAVMQKPDGITPVFQPLVALATGRISGYEALARFKQPPQRFPDQWFSLAMRVGLGAALEAVAIAKALAVPGRPLGTDLSLNLSPSTLRSPEVQAVLPTDLSGLVIEITEHELASDDTVLTADLAALRERGAQIAVDDAGAGYAGLQQLMRVAPDMIKLDRSLVQNIHEDPAKQALVDSFVRFGRRTGAQVVAEGIETEDELRVLADLDVTYGQGYFLAKPGPSWPSISPWISEKLMQRSLGAQISVEDISKLPAGGDQRLAAVAARIAHATTLDDIGRLVPIIRDELSADELVLFTRGYDGALVATAPQPWLPSGGRLELTHFPAFEGVLRTGEPEQILADRGSGTTTGMGEIALLANSGYGSLLIVPVGPHALIHAFMSDQRPWSRQQTNRALVLAYQLAPVLAVVAAHAPAV